MTALSVNVNKVAMLRNSRGGTRPDVVACARAALDAGADGITVHPRPDERHIRADDVHALRSLVAEYPAAEFNIEGNPQAAARGGYPGFDHLVEAARPHQCTLVPDADGQLTSDHGWDLAGEAVRRQVAQIAERYRGWGARVSLFMDPDDAQIRRAKEVGADRIELYTGPYADSVLRHGMDAAQTSASLAEYSRAARFARGIGLGVNAGHDLDLVNLARFLAIGDIAEVSIGHALIADALEVGLVEAVRRYADVCRGGANERTG